MRLRGIPALLLLLTALALAACRSAAPDLAPAEPVAPPAPSVASPPSEPAPAVAAVAPAPEPPRVEPAPAEAPAQEEEPASEAERVQREALEACQSADELLGRGEVEAAIVAVDRAYALMLELPANGDDTSLQAKEDIRILAASLIERAYQAGRRAPARASTSWDLALPTADNLHVRREIQSFTNGEREQFLEGYRRSGLYRPMILERLEKAGLPSQLSWLPLVESWFKVKALSRASALGPWQFISSTGVRYGLNRDQWVDERMDPEKSTDAAIAYLTTCTACSATGPRPSPPTTAGRPASCDSPARRPGSTSTSGTSTRSCPARRGATCPACSPPSRSSRAPKSTG